MLKNIIHSFKRSTAIAAMLAVCIFASSSVLAFNLDNKNSKVMTNIIQPDNTSIKLAKGQYMMPGRCWLDCSCNANSLNAEDRKYS